MTDKQYAVYMFLIKYIKENGYPPTLEEIADGVGAKAKSTISIRLMELQEDGWIEVKMSSPRTIKVVGYNFVEA
ncbi:MAG: LexA repressor [Lachnospira sp.]|jgi:repressor LexA|nr:LexA repressor [Lachnospira sp.]